MPVLTKKRPTNPASARITFEMPGVAAQVLEIRSRDAKIALRMLEGLKIAVTSIGDEEPARPWREALGGVLDLHGGEAAAMVRACRDAKKMTQQQLAAAVGVQKTHVSEIERGKRSVGKALARKLATVLEVDYRTFL